VFKISSYRLGQFFLIFAILIQWIVFSHCKEQTPHPKVVGGKLDLPKGWYDANATFSLDGEWEVFWNQFPTVSNPEFGLNHGILTPIPSEWEGQTYLDHNGQLVGATTQGFATYRLIVDSSEDQMLGIRIPDQGSSMEFRVNQKLVAQSGKVGTSKEESLSARTVEYKSFPLQKGQNELLLIVSNFEHGKTGFWNSISIGSVASIESLKLSLVGLDLFIVGIVFIMGLYYCILYFLLKENISTVLFGLYCWIVCLRTLTIGERYITHLIPNLGFSLEVQLEYLTLYWGLPIFIIFVDELYPKESIKKVSASIVSFSLLLSLPVIFLSPIQFHKTLVWWQIVLVVGLMYVVYVFIKASIQKREGAKSSLFGFMVFTILILNDVLYSHGIVNTGNFGSLGFVFFIFSQSHILSARFARAYKQSKDLSANLEKKVEERTKDLEIANNDLLSQREFLIQAEEESKKKSLRIQRIQEISMIVQKSKNFDEMLEKVKERLYFHYGFQNYNIYLVNYDKKVIEYLRSEYLSIVPVSVIESLDKSSIPINEPSSIHAAVVRNQKSLLLKRVLTDKIYSVEVSNLTIFGVNAIYFLPLFAEDRLFALFTIIDCKPEYQYKESVKNLTKADKEEIEILSQSIGNSLFQSLQKKNLEKAESQSRVLNQELNKQKTRLERIQKASVKIQNATSFDSMCDNLKEEFLNSFGIETYIFYLLNHEEQNFKLYRIETKVSLPEPILRQLDENLIHSNAKNSIHGSVFKNKKPFFIKSTKRGNLAEDEKFNLELINISSIFLIPLIVGGKVFAILSLVDIDENFGMKHRIQSLSKEEREDLVLLSQSIASGFYQSLQKQKFADSQSALSRAERESSVNQLAAHIAHEVNNPLNFISTGESIIESTMEDSSKFILSAIPDTEDSKPFRTKISNFFSDFRLGIEQIKKGYSRIKDTVSEIRAITKVDGIQVDNFDFMKIFLQNLDLTIEKNQINLNDITIKINDHVYPNITKDFYSILTQKHILGRAFRTLLNNNIFFAQKSTHVKPEIKVLVNPIQSSNPQIYAIEMWNNGPAIETGKEIDIFDLKKQKSFGTELIGLAMVKELLKSIQCNMSLIDHGRESGWVGYQIMVKDYE
jgi:GAF domain-containing protein